jgi:hypothetical protein
MTRRLIVVLTLACMLTLGGRVAAQLAVFDPVN